AGVLILETEVGRTCIPGWVTELPQLVLPWIGEQGGGFTPEDARLAHIVFKLVTR
ncbi:hypothetical protein LCGC14_1746630, partial [marine sediment metagenome]